LQALRSLPGPIITTTIIITIITTRKRRFSRCFLPSAWAAAVVSLSLIAFGSAVMAC
jgi:hypothetical protein